MHFLNPSLRNLIVDLDRSLGAVLAVAAPRVAQAEALLVVEADTGKVLQAENATYPWYPASVTKIMTAYVTLKAVKEGRLTLEQPLTVSPVAASQSPSKMGFRPGTQVTVENALEMMMVKSANDMAVVLAEGVAGSVDGFSAQMNATRAAARHDADQLRQSERTCPPKARSPRRAISRSWRARSFAICRNTNISCTSPRSASAAA